MKTTVIAHAVVTGMLVEAVRTAAVARIDARARSLRWRFVAAFALTAGLACAWWNPDAGQYPYERIDATYGDNVVNILGTAVTDRDRMLDIVLLFPPYTFDRVWLFCDDYR